MSPDDDLLIQRYIASELDATERAALAQRLRTDADFAAEALTDIQTANLIGSALRAPLPAQVTQAVEQALALTRPTQRLTLFTTVLGRIRYQQRMRWIGRFGAAAALCGLLITWWVWQSAGTVRTDGQSPVVATQLIEPDHDTRVPLDDGSYLYITAGSRVQIEHDSRGVLCRLERGRLTAEVTPQDAGQSVRVQTTHALVQVIGTRFSVALGAHTEISVAKGLVHVQQADGTQGHVAAGFQVESTGRGPMLPLANAVTLTEAPRLGYTWPSGHDALANELFTLMATKQRHWISVEIPNSTVSWNWSDGFYAEAMTRKARTLQNAFFWSDIIRPNAKTPADAHRAVDEWLSAFLARYRTRLHLWEVTDEPLTAVPAYGALLGGAGSTGWDWLIWLHQRARQHAPTIPLLLGGFQELGSAEATKRFATVGSLLHDRGLLDGLVIKAHALQQLDPKVVRANLDRLARVGVPLYLCEVDIDVADDQAHAVATARIMPVLWEHPAVRALVFWGLRQGSSFRAGDHLVTNTGVERPAVKWLRNYLATDVVRAEFPRTAVASPTATIPLILCPGHASQGITRVEVAHAGTVVGTAHELPALLELPSFARDGRPVVLRAFVGNQLIREVSYQVGIPP